VVNTKSHSVSKECSNKFKSNFTLSQRQTGNQWQKRESFSPLSLCNWHFFWSSQLCCRQFLSSSNFFLSLTFLCVCLQVRANSLSFPMWASNSPSPAATVRRVRQFPSPNIFYSSLFMLILSLSLSLSISLCPKSRCTTTVDQSQWLCVLVIASASMVWVWTVLKKERKDFEFEFNIFESKENLRKILHNKGI